MASLQPSEKLSLYKPASPFERGSLSQGRLHVSTPTSSQTPHSGRRPHSHGHTHSSEAKRQGMETSSHRGPPLPSSHSPQTPDHNHSLSLSDSDETTPTTTPSTQAYPKPPTTTDTPQDFPAVHVVRHTFPEGAPQHPGRFSSDFVDLRRNTSSPHYDGVKTPPTLTLHTPTSHPHSSRMSVESRNGSAIHKEEGGEGGAGEGDEGCGVVRSVSDEVVTNRHQVAKERDTSIHSRSVELATIPEDSSSLSQRTKPRKGKGRVVPSRYKTATTHHHTPSSSTSSLQKPATTASKSQPAKKPPSKSFSKMDDSFKIPAHSSRSRLKRPPAPSTTLQIPPTPQLHLSTAAIATSTPVVGSGPHPQSVTHGGSFMDTSHNASTKSTTSRSKSKTATDHISGHVSDLKLELLYSRLLQASYLDVKSAKSLREQEEAAKTQLHVLWQKAEEKRKEKEALKQLVETEHRTSALSTALHVQVAGLSRLCVHLPKLQQHHCALSHALDSTRHELATSGVLPATEQQLEAELARSEQLLAEIVTSIRQKVPTVVSFTQSTQAAVNTLDNEFQELEKCWNELSKAVKSQVHETSLFFERRQRQRTLHPITS